MVEWKIIDDVIISLKTGLNPRANFILNTPESKIPYITGKDIFENRINVTDKTDKIDGKALSLINKRACLEDNLLLFASTGTGTVGRMAIVDKYNNDWGMSETLYAIKTKDYITPYYLMYCLYSHTIKSQFEPKISKGSVPHLKVVDLLNVKIPIPSIQEQERIVGILDTFTSSIDNLKQQIVQRRKQYEYYRDQLLDLEGKEGVEMKTLGEIGAFIRGNGIQKSDFVEDGFGCIHYGQIHARYGFSAEETLSKIEESLYKKCKKAQKGDVILATTSEDAEGVAKPFVWLGDEKIAVSGDAFIYHHNQNGKFMGYQFLTHKFMQFKVKNATGAKVVRISGDNMSKFEVALPSIEKQNEIVDILDKFEASIQNLEAQLSQREKQYEYYCNKLLTFK